jgi:hypothetical protein
MDTEIVTWAALDDANKADEHYAPRWPEFYRAALEAEQQALIDRNAAINAWIDCPTWDAVRMRELRRAVTVAEERWTDCRSAVNTLYGHWMRLLRDARGECECTPGQVTVCRACLAESRLNNPAYEPNLNELLHEE